jgi:hypothetical protein
MACTGYSRIQILMTCVRYDRFCLVMNKKGLTCTILIPPLYRVELNCRCVFAGRRKGYELKINTTASHLLTSFKETITEKSFDIQGCYSETGPYWHGP